MGKKSKNYLIFIFFFLFAIFLGGTARAEDTTTQRISMQISPICVINVSKSPNSLIIQPIPAGGRLPDNAIENSTFIQYSSTVARGQTRTLTAQWEPSDSAPSGCSLLLQAIPSGKVNEGAGAGEITLSSFPQALIKEIGSCATGSGPQNGAQLIYRLAVTNIEEVTAGESRIATIIFTLTDGF